MNIRIYSNKILKENTMRIIFFIENFKFFTKYKGINKYAVLWNCAARIIIRIYLKNFFLSIYLIPTIKNVNAITCLTNGSKRADIKNIIKKK